MIEEVLRLYPPTWLTARMPASAALYAAFGTAPPAVDIEPRNESVDTLFDRAIAHGDERAIKFTEACLRQHACDRSPAYLAAVHGALGALPRVNG